MGIRRNLINLLIGPPEVTRDDLRRVTEEAASTTTAQASGADPALDEKFAKVEKKLNMAMGAVQAATAQIMSLKKDVEELSRTVGQASQQATTARSTAEAAADGLSGVEGQLAALVERLGQPAAQPAPAAAKAAAKPKTGKGPGRPPKSTVCQVPGCGRPHRARGYCAMHYQQVARGQSA